MNDLKLKGLSQLVDIFNNVRVPLSSKQREHLEKIYPYYGAQGIVDYVDDFLFDGEYILIAEDGENLKSNNQNICNLVNGKFWVNNHAHIVRANSKNHTKYLYYNFNRIKFEPYVTGSSQPKLNKENLLNIKAYVHDNINEQKSIAKVLSDLDAKIELNNKINRELEAMAKTLYDYWFVQFDFPDADGKPYKSSGGKMVYNAELKREIPEGWEVKPLSKITSVSNESINPMLSPDKDFKHYSIPTFDATKAYGIEKGIDIRSNKFTVAETDLLVSKLNPWFSRVIYPIKEDDLICSTEFVVWRTSSSNIKNYLFMVATGKHFISHCTQSATGTSNSHKRVNPAVMMRYKVPYNADLIQKYGVTIDTLLKDITSKRIENQHLTALRDWLLPMLMNGQVSVRQAYGESEAAQSMSMAAEPAAEYTTGKKQSM